MTNDKELADLHGASCTTRRAIACSINSDANMDTCAVRVKFRAAPFQGAGGSEHYPSCALAFDFFFSLENKMKIFFHFFFINIGESGTLMQAADALLAAQNLGRQNPSLAVTLFRRFRPRGDEGDDTSGKSLVGVLSWYAGVLWGRQCVPSSAGENGMRAQAFADTSGRARSSLTLACAACTC